MGQAPTSFSAATKTFCTEHEQRVADSRREQPLAPNALGGDALASGSATPARTRSWAALNVLRNIIGERVLGLPREPA